MTLVVLTVLAALLGLQAALLTDRCGPTRRRRLTASLRVTVRRLAEDERAVRRGVLLAMAVGLALRVVWVVLATRSAVPFQDAAEYLRTAEGFLAGDMPTFRSGAHSAFWAPGYPLLLVPFLALADGTGWASPTFTASLVNALGGAATIALTAFLAGRWISPRARVPAAWLVALTPALVFWTSTAHTESAFTPFFLGALALVTVAVDQPAGGSTRRWLVAGLVCGFAFLIRSPAVVLFLTPLLAVWGRDHGWRDAVRPTALLLAGAAVLLVPWTVRNGVQVGVWTPASTSNATGPCFGHRADAEAQFTNPTDDLLQDCFRNSPFDDERLRDQLEAVGGLPPDWEFAHPDEPGWYGERLREAARWAFTHPTDEIRLSALKVWETWHDERPVVDAARNFAPQDDWSRRWARPLAVAANLWLWMLLALGVGGIVTSRAARWALPIWGLIVASTALIAGGVGYPNYRYPVLPLVAVLGAAFLTRAPERAPTGDSSAGQVAP